MSSCQGIYRERKEGNGKKRKLTIHPRMEEVCFTSTLCHDALLDRWGVTMDEWVRGDQFFYRVPSPPCSLFVTFCSRSCFVRLLVCLRIYTRPCPPRNKLSHRGNETISPFPSSLALVSSCLASNFILKENLLGGREMRNRALLRSTPQHPS